MTDEIKDYECREDEHQAEDHMELSSRLDRSLPGITAAVLLLCLYSVLCIFLPVTLGVRADLATPSPDAKPAWYFLFIYEYLRLVPPLLGALTPTILLVLLGALPFFDRNPSRDPRMRVVALATATIVIVAILALTYLGWVS